MKRRTFSKEFKLEAVKLLQEGGLTIPQGSLELGVSQSALGKWVREHRNASAEAFPGSGNLKPEDQKVRELEKKVRRLEMERDILKKATAFFAKESQ